MLAPRGSPSKIVALIAAVCGLSNFLEGYSSSYPNTAADSFRNFINESYIARGKGPLSIWWYTWYWSLVLNIWFVGYFAGTVFTPFITDNYGRKNGLCLANSISLLGTVITAIGIYMGIPEMLLIGRTVAAVGSGLSFGSLILFIQETTPTNLRGTCSFLSEVSYIAVNVIGMGAGMDLLLGQHLFALIAIGAVPSILSILIVLPLKESPKFLLLNRKDRKAAIEALRFYQGNNGVSLDNEQQAADDAAMDEILKESPDAPGGKNEPVSLWKALLQVTKQPHLRKAVAIGTLSLQIIVGIWPIIYISTDLLEAHFDPNASQYSSFAFICANFVASIIGTCSVEKFGRRPMLICCGIANTLCLLAYIIFDRMTTAGTALYVDDQFKYGCIASLIAYGITYGAALGPIAFFITSELVPQHYRSLVQSIVFMVNTVINFIFSFITLPLYELIDVWAFIPLFIIPSTFAIIYLIKELPETKGREIHEIVEQLKRGSRHHHTKSGDGKKKKNRQREKGLEQGQRVSNGSVTSAASSTSSSSGNQLAAEKFPQILLGAAGHGKNSLIKTSAGGAAIVAAVTKMMRQQQQAAFGVSSITADVAANKNIGGPLTTVEEEADCELDKPE